ncbi:hypothetical protein [Micromonospora rifamycinica]|uniref:Uncharacterized protein n=1 Tax=Micromonospora rifamycinica TaxID=291594 RepID=A0A1C5JWH4_9ACTN|nr:hypothetical protein [Micromonospora rifamycinica]SCG74920.1 hypothetical protein GA0070623_3944 [Micromonospora rifamycinica]
MRRRIRAALLAVTTLGMVVASAGVAQARESSQQTQPPQASQQSQRDARAAAAASNGLGAAAKGGIGTAATWFTGTVPVGGTQGWTWTNAPADAAYVVGYNPAGATTSATCQFETISSKYVQLSSGERQFHFTLKNVGSIACGATVQLAAVTSTSLVSTGGVSPGGTQTYLWNVPWNTIWVAGLNPNGATSSTACQFQVTRIWTVQPGSSLRQIWVEVKNVGAVTCQADVRLGSTTIGSQFAMATVGAGGTWSTTWNNANPVTSAYVIGPSPQGSFPTYCQFEVTRVVYAQRINADGSSQRQITMSFKNLSTLSCGGTAYLQAIAA